jgi:hypothetical protein
VKILFAALFLFCITAPVSAQAVKPTTKSLKPGTPEWDRHFAELRKKGEEARKKGEALRKKSSSTFSSKSSSSLRSKSSFSSSFAGPKSDAESKRTLERLREERKKKELDAIPAEYRKAYADAQNPAAFDHAHTPSVEVTVKHLQKVMAKATKLEEIVPYLSAPFRQRFIELLSGQNYGSGDNTPAGELAHYKDFFKSMISYDSSQGSAKSDYAYGYIWTKGRGEVLYQLEFVGEGKLWRLNGWKAQVIRQ